jgi:hypothetical protein
MKTTLITAYFELPISKKSHDQYIEWMKNMLIIETPMVIFSDEASKPLIKQIRGTLPSYYVTLDFDDFYTARYETTFYEHQLLDREIAVGHNPQLYMIWNEKSHFLKQAADLNPFQTDYFLWVDIGCFREPNTQYIQWPNPEKIAQLEPNKMLMVQVYPFLPDELEKRTLETIPSFQFTNRIGGTMFGGTKGVIDLWHKEYYQMLEHFIRIERFIGKDQSIMNSVYLWKPQLVQLISQRDEPEPRYGMSSEWFYMQDFLL